MVIQATRKRFWPIRKYHVKVQKPQPGSAAPTVMKFTGGFAKKVYNIINKQNKKHLKAKAVVEATEAKMKGLGL